MRVSAEEAAGIDLSLLADQGLSLQDTRAWHLRAWLPSLPAGEIDIVYDFRMLAGVPTYEVDLKMSQWMPKYLQLTIVANGLEGQDVELFIDGLDTTTPRNVEVNAVFSTKKGSPYLRFPWTCSTMRACASNPHMPSSTTTMRSLG